MADEMDIAFEKTTCIMGSTDNTVDQGGSGGSTAMERDAWPMRRAAAEARRVLLEMGSAQLGVPADRLTVSDCVITVKNDPSKRITYGELIGGKRFNVTLTGANVNAATGVAKLKPVQDLRTVGQSPQRYDIPAKVDGSLKWAVDVKLPGMVHARNVKPPFAGAKLTGIDESSVRGMPGFVKVLSKGNYVAVVCEREEQAINASRQLKTTWEKPATAPFPASEDLFNLHSRRRAYVRRQRPIIVGDPDAAFAGAPKLLEADYEIPFQGHTAISGAHATADPSNGQMTVYSNDMKSYGMRRGVADFPRHAAREGACRLDGRPAGFRPHRRRRRGMRGRLAGQRTGTPGSYPVDAERRDGVGYEGPGFRGEDARAVWMPRGNLVAYDYNARTVDYNHVGYNEPDTVLIAQFMGSRRANPDKGSSATPSEMYAIPNRRMATEVVSLPLIWETPLRTGNLRDPNGPQSTFASESFIDELAAAAKADPYEFRLKLLMAETKEDAAFRRARSIAVLKAAAAAYGWDTRPSPKPRGSGNILTGRGIAYGFRGSTMVAEIAEVEVNRQTGHVWAKRLVCAHDCGLVVNPQSLRHSVECGMLHSLSRAIHEEVQFDTEKVISVDWNTHPTLTHADTPASIEVVLVNGDPNPNRPDLPPYGGGEASCKPMLAAIANAIHDATGVRLRRLPFRDARVLAALNAARV